MLDGPPSLTRAPAYIFHFQEVSASPALKQISNASWLLALLSDPFASF